MKAVLKLTVLTQFLFLAFFTQPSPVLAQDHCIRITSESTCKSAGCNWTGYRCSGSGSSAQNERASDILTTIDPVGGKYNSIGDIINSVLPILFSAAGLVLFGMLIMGGFTMLTAISDPKKAEAGKQTITTAIIGFVIIFCAYWLTQILEIILGVSIL